jgi:acetyltransferase-like isoleucine patch superfamily enzyme
VWIGAAVTVTPGVTIGRGSVVGAGAVVARDVPPLSVVTATSAVRRKIVKSP